MKYLILLTTLFLTSCYACENLGLCAKRLNIANYYNKQIVNGEIVKHKKSETNETFFYEFHSKISDEEMGEIFLFIEDFKKNHKLIGKFETSSNLLKDKRVSKEEIEEASREIGAKYTLAYEFHEVRNITFHRGKAFAYSGEEHSVYYLILFFTEKDG